MLLCQVSTGGYCKIKSGGEALSPLPAVMHVTCDTDTDTNIIKHVHTHIQRERETHTHTCTCTHIAHSFCTRVLLQAQEKGLWLINSWLVRRQAHEYTHTHTHTSPHIHSHTHTHTVTWTARRCIIGVVMSQSRDSPCHNPRGIISQG